MINKKEIKLTYDEALAIIFYYRKSYLAYTSKDLNIIKKLSKHCNDKGLDIK